MKRVLAFVLSLCLLCPAAYAGGPVKLKAGVPFTPTEDGWYFTVEQEQEIRFRLVEADFIEKKLNLQIDLTESYKNKLLLQEQISDKYRTAWLESDDRLTDVLKRESRTKFWYLLLGIGLTVGAGFAMGAAK